MSHRTPLIAAVLTLTAIPAACSNDDSKNEGTSASGGSSGLELETGGMGGRADSDGTGDSDGPVLNRCTSFEGLTECNTAGLNATPVDVSILLLVDASGSMGSPLPDDDRVTLWNATSTALKEALRAAQSSISFGLDLFPNTDTNYAAQLCEMPEDADLLVPIAPGPENREAIIAMMARKGPGGGTPTAAGLKRAYEYYTTGAGKDVKGSRFVLLATDGGPNCNEDLNCERDTCTANIDAKPDDKVCGKEAGNCCEDFGSGCLDDSGTLQAIETLSSIGVDTFVVGLPGSEIYEQQLNKFAIEGGRPNTEGDEKYFKVDSMGATEGLTEVLTAITRQLVTSCEVELDAPPTSKTLLNLAVDCEVLPRLEEDGGMGGNGGSSSDASSWFYNKGTNRAVIVGPKCDEIESEGVERIDIIEGCPVLR